MNPLYNSEISGNRTRIPLHRFIDSLAPSNQIKHKIEWPAKLFPERHIIILDHVFALHCNKEPYRGRSQSHRRYDVVLPSLECAWVNFIDVHAKHNLAQASISPYITDENVQLTFTNVAGMKTMVRYVICFICHVRLSHILPYGTNLTTHRCKERQHRSTR